MDLTLRRVQFREDGIFSDLQTSNGSHFCQALDHAYYFPDKGYLPKIPMGVFKCVRGKHRLHNMTEDFETFEITGVEGHTNLLMHSGNYNKDSEGCILLGAHIERAEDQTQMLTHSKETFERFMALQAGLDEFQLTVC